MLTLTRTKATVVGAVSVLLACAVAVVLPAGRAGASTADTFLAPPSGSWTVIGHGNGHGHGLSQYGSYGRASAGQTMPQIVSFYYPGATLTAASAANAATPIRVGLGGAGSYTTVAASGNVFVSGVAGPLPAAGVNAFRLVPAGAGLGLQQLTSTWLPVTGAQALPATSTFSTDAGLLTLIRGDGSRGFYRGSLTAIRNGATDVTVNTLSLDDYVRGVAPNESPSSWPAAALQAQVVAARTYALFEIGQAAGGGAFEVCDSSNCQVYGGASSEAASTDAAVAATAGQVLTYAGAPIFAQFSSSNGGWTADGGKPYLVAAPDPFDNAATDPWFNWTRTVPVAQVAAYYGLSSVTGLRVLSRDGHGDWGGGVTSVAVDGLSAGKATTVTATGYSIRSAMGLPLQWFTITNGGQPLPAAPTAMTLQPGNGSVAVQWNPPAANGAKPITGYVLTVAGLTRRAVAAPVLSITLSGLTNGTARRVYVQAMNADGVGAPAGLIAVPAAPVAGAPATPARVSSWSQNGGAQIYWAPSTDTSVRGYSVTVLGRVRRVLAASALHAVLTNLPNAVPQTVYVRAFNAAGESPAFGLSVRPSPVPAAPRTLHLTAAAGSVVLRWSAPPAPSAVPAVAGYSVTLIGSSRHLLGAASRTDVLSGLVPGHFYRVYVRAINALGEGPAYMTGFFAT